MSFNEWLQAELVNDGIFDEGDYGLEILSEQMLLEDTEVDADDLEVYREQFEAHCKSMGVEPEWDLPED